MGDEGKIKKKYTETKGKKYSIEILLLKVYTLDTQLCALLEPSCSLKLNSISTEIKL